MKLTVYILCALFILSACSFNQGRYQQSNDSTPVRTPTAAELHDAIPRVEKPSRGGNKNYSVFGKSYQVLASAENFQQTGTASWYGKKFHGHLTSNGEIYDMYSMSAAHKNLPLPTYLKVTNLANNKSTIVRVNDRGPFHQQRIIDLSYSAAYKLDMLKTGTANVHIQAISQLPAKQKTSSTKSNINTTEQKNKADRQADVSAKETNDKQPLTAFTTTKPFYIQVFATKSLSTAKATAQKLATEFSQQIAYPYSNGIFRILVGPIIQSGEQQRLLDKLKMLGYPNAYAREKIN